MEDIKQGRFLVTKNAPEYVMMMVHRQTSHNTLEYLLFGDLPPSREREFKLSHDERYGLVYIINTLGEVQEMCNLLFVDYQKKTYTFNRVGDILILDLKLQQGDLRGSLEFGWVEFPDEDTFNRVWARQIEDSINKNGEYPLAIICDPHTVTD